MKPNQSLIVFGLEFHQNIQDFEEETDAVQIKISSSTVIRIVVKFPSQLDKDYVSE